MLRMCLSSLQTLSFRGSSNRAQWVRVMTAIQWYGEARPLVTLSKLESTVMIFFFFSHSDGVPIHPTRGSRDAGSKNSPVHLGSRSGPRWRSNCHLNPSNGFFFSPFSVLAVSALHLRDKLGDSTGRISAPEKLELLCASSRLVGEWREKKVALEGSGNWIEICQCWN